MTFVDESGNSVNLEDLEPWCHYVEYDGKKHPILFITYTTATPEGRRNSIKVEWND